MKIKKILHFFFIYLSPSDQGNFNGEQFKTGKDAESLNKVIDLITTLEKVLFIYFQI